MKPVASFSTTRGGSGCRTVTTAQEAEKLLKGGYGVSTVTIRHGDVVIGQRIKGHIESKRWWWWYDTDYFDKAVP